MFVTGLGGLKEIFGYLLGPPYFKYIPTIFLGFPGLPQSPKPLAPNRIHWIPLQNVPAFHQAKDCINVDRVKCCIPVFVATIDPEAEIEVGVNIHCAERSQLVAKPMLAANIRSERAGPVLLQGITSIALWHQ